MPYNFDRTFSFLFSGTMPVLFLYYVQKKDSTDMKAQLGLIEDPPQSSRD